MTREEAIKLLQRTTNLGDGIIIEGDTSKIKEALNMAIKTLEQEPCEDATLKDIFCMGCKYKEQEPRWIPVSERLPSDNKEVLVYLNACPYLAWFENGKWWTDDFVIDKDFEPIAWMPLPLPWKAESEGKE